MKKTKITSLNGIIGVVINVILSITLSKYFGVLGIAIATSIAAFIISILLFNSTRKLIGSFNVGELLLKIFKIMISSLIMIISLYYFNKLININNSFIIILLDGTIGAIIFFILCKILKIEEFEEALSIIKDRFIRRNS